VTLAEGKGEGGAAIFHGGDKTARESVRDINVGNKITPNSVNKGERQM